MPARLKSICRAPGCHALTDNPGYCMRHAHMMPKPWGNRSSASDGRMRGRRLQQARAALFRSNPLCVNCERNGIVRLATERDHIINLADGGTDDPSNTQGLCKDCHQAKTQQESQRARAR
jgi:5-methylcytosine-specific restriction protein A